jgi:hypothetical protein
MSHLLTRQSTIEMALLTGVSSGSGLINFSAIGGDFTPTISTDTVTLDAGYEYFIATALTTSSNATVTYNHIFNGVSGTSYSIGTTSTSSGLDQLFDTVNASANISFQINSSDAITNNSRIEIWRSIS